MKTRKWLLLMQALILWLAACQPAAVPATATDLQVTNITEEEIVTAEIKQIKTFNQCDSSSTLRTEVQFSDSSAQANQQQLVLGAEITGGGKIAGAVELELKGSIEKHFSQTLQQGQGHSESTSIEVPAHTQQEYTIIWQETRRKGAVDYIENGMAKSINYSYRVGLELVSVSGRDIDCSGQTIVAAPTLLPTENPPQLTPHFSEIRFCLENEFNETSRSCTVARTEFPRQVDRIFVSWNYSNVYIGMFFSRKWYQNDQMIKEVIDDIWDGKDWEINGTSEFTWLDASVLKQDYFPQGFYSFELFIGNTLEQTSRFSVVE